MKISKFFRSAFSSCPYTILGKKAIGCFSGERCDPARVVTITERNIMERIKMGRNIALIGVFCPFFWIAVFSGATAHTVLLNGIHSGLVIAIGLGVVVTYRQRLGRFRKNSIQRKSGTRSVTNTASAKNK